jgi:hypothetical protein
MLAAASISAGYPGDMSSLSLPTAGRLCRGRDISRRTDKVLSIDNNSFKKLAYKRGRQFTGIRADRRKIVET